MKRRGVWKTKKKYDNASDNVIEENNKLSIERYPTAEKLKQKFFDYIQQNIRKSWVCFYLKFVAEEKFKISIEHKMKLLFSSIYFWTYI